MREFYTLSDNEKIYYYVFDDVRENEKDIIVQINHGIAEYGLRYEEFAKVLNENGFVAVASDHPGHGKTAKRLGFTKGDALCEIVNATKSVYKEIKKMYPDKKIVSFGHSMGSFIALKSVEERPKDYDALILCGTDGPQNPFLNIIATPLANTLKLFKLDKKNGTKLNSLVFNSYNKGFEGRTKFDWLNRDKGEVDKYINDSLCGFDMSDAFIISLIHHMPKWFRKDSLNNIEITTPILIISGDKDPVGHYGAGPKKLVKSLKELGNNNVSLKLYKDARHEILLELSKEETFKDIIEFLNQI